MRKRHRRDGQLGIDFEGEITRRGK